MKSGGVYRLILHEFYGKMELYGILNILIIA